MDPELELEAIPSVLLSSGKMGIAEWSIVTNLPLTASIDEDGVRKIHGTASSTITDLHGDEMTKSALEDMERSANAGLTIFLNHSYQVPEDIGGSVTFAKMAKRKAEDGMVVWDLDFDIDIDDTNERAVQLHRSIMGTGKKKGTKVGLSIGAMIPEDGAKRRKDGSYLIEHVNLLETSLVGIPANQRSWVQNAVKSIKSAQAGPVETKAATQVQMGTPKLTLDPVTRMYRVEGSFDGLDLVNGTEPEVQGSVSEAKHEPECNEGCDPEKGIHNLLGDQGDGTEVVPDVQDAKITVIEIDTGSGSGSGEDTGTQEAQESAPENEAGLADETADGDDEALGDPVTRGLDLTSAPGVGTVLKQTIDLLNKTLADLLQARKDLEIEKAARAEAEAREAQIREKTEKVLGGVSEVISKIASTPLKSRTRFIEAQGRFDHLKSVYGEEFLKELEGASSNGKR